MKRIRKNYKTKKFQHILSRKPPRGDQSSSDDDETEGQIKHLSSHLGNYDSRSKELATTILMNISPGISQEQFLQLMNDENGLQTVMNNLSSNEPQIILNTLNGLQNLAKIDYRVADSLFSKKLLELKLLDHLKNIVEQLIPFLQNMSNSFLLEKSKKHNIITIIEAVYALVSTLIEVLEENIINEVIIKSKVTELVFEIIGIYQKHHAIHDPAYVSDPSDENDDQLIISCLNFVELLTEFSSDVCTFMITHPALLPWFRDILMIKERNPQIRSYLASILYNIMNKRGDAVESSLLHKYGDAIVEYVYYIFSIKIFEELSNLKVKIEPLVSKCLEKGHPKKKNTEKMVEEETIDDELAEEDPSQSKKMAEFDISRREAKKIWKKTGKAINITLGFLINLFEDDEEDFEDEVDDDDEEFAVEEEKKLNSEAQSGGIKGVGLSTHSTFKELIIEKLLNEVFLNFLIEKIKLVSVDYILFFSNNEMQMNDIYSEIKSIMAFALSSLINIFSNYYERFDKSKQEDILKALLKIFWEEINKLIKLISGDFDTNEDFNEEDVGLEEIFILQEKMFLILLKKSDAVARLFPAMELLGLSKPVAHLKEEDGVIMYIDIVSHRFADKFKATREEIMFVSDFFIEMLKNENIMIAAQALNGIFDVFSEETYDDIFVAKNMMVILQHGCQLLQNNIKSYKKQVSKENFLFLKDMLFNLKRFIKYKKEHIPNL